MSEAVYHVATPEELAELMCCDEYTVLLGPDKFACMLGEPEDRSWCRDASLAVDRLNEQHSEIVKMREALEKLARLGNDIARAALATPEPPDDEPHARRTE